MVISYIARNFETQIMPNKNKRLLGLPYSASILILHFDILFEMDTIRGLTEAMNAHNLKYGLVITEKDSETLRIDEKEIQIMPIYEWLNKIQS